MRRMLILAVVLAGALWCVGCDRKHNLSDFPLKPGLTADELADALGSPTRVAPHWVVYSLTDGNELRIYFLERTAGDVRTLTRADLYTKDGELLKNIYVLPRPMPATAPATLPVAATEPVTQP